MKKLYLCVLIEACFVLDIMEEIVVSVILMEAVRMLCFGGCLTTIQHHIIYYSCLTEKRLGIDSKKFSAESLH